MRIGYFTDSYRPYTSGVVRSIETFTKELHDLGHKVYIFAPSYPNSAPEPGVFRYISIPSPTHQDFTLAIPISPYLRSTAKKLGLDIVHVHSPFLLGRMGARYAKSMGMPLVCTYHTLYDQYAHYVPIAQSLSKAIIRRITRDFCNNTNLVIAPTGVIKDVLIHSGVTAPIEVIPTGIDTKEFTGTNPQWLKQHYNLCGKQVLLHVGRLGPEKNIEFLIKAFSEIVKRHPTARLVLVGGGPQAEHYVSLTQSLGLSDQVIFTGMLPRNLVVDCYVGADLFVFASVTETQGIVLGEAKAAGLPVVAVKAFGAAEMVRDGQDGFLVEMNLGEFVNQALRLLQDDQLRNRMRQQAIVNVTSISARYCAQRLAQAYASLVYPDNDNNNSISAS